MCLDRITILLLWHEILYVQKDFFLNPFISNVFIKNEKKKKLQCRFLPDPGEVRLKPGLFTKAANALIIRLWSKKISLKNYSDTNKSAFVSNLLEVKKSQKS